MTPHVTFWHFIASWSIFKDQKLDKSRNFKNTETQKDQIIRYFIFFLTLTWLREGLQSP